MSQIDGTIKHIIASAHKSMPKPFSEHVTLSTIQFVNASANRRQQFINEQRTLGRARANQTFGRCVRDAVGGIAIKQVDPPKGELIGSYSILQF